MLNLNDVFTGDILTPDAIGQAFVYSQPDFDKSGYNFVVVDKSETVIVISTMQVKQINSEQHVNWCFVVINKTGTLGWIPIGWLQKVTIT